MSVTCIIDMRLISRIYKESIAISKTTDPIFKMVKRYEDNYFFKKQSYDE